MSTSQRTATVSAAIHQASGWQQPWNAVMAANYDELPAYGYRSDARMAANMPYGTYPGKRAHITRFLDGCGNDDDDGSGGRASDERPLLRSTTNAYETHWQPPANPAILTLTMPPAIVPNADATPQSQRRSSRADSPQRGILRRRASPALPARPNLFDCPSASTLALTGSHNGGIRQDSYTARSNKLASAGANLASELRQLNTTNQNAAWTKTKSTTSTVRRRCRFCAEVFRAAIVECAAMILLVLVHYQARFHLDIATTRQPQTLTTPLVIALVDATAALAIYAAFPTAQLSPLVTLAHVFCSLVPLCVCAAVLVAQLLAILLSSVLLFLYLKYDTKLILRTPAVELSAASTGGDALARELHQLVLSGVLSATLLVISHLRGSQYVWRVDVRKRHLPKAFSLSLAGTFASVWLSAFFSLSHSTVSWNVAFASVAALVDMARRSDWADVSTATSVWQNQHIFWQGPTIGALLAVVLYRLAFSPESARKVHEIAAERAATSRERHCY